MACENPQRPRVISEQLKIVLADLLAFRHFYRHSYSYQLKWKEIEKLVIPVQQTWKDFRTEITIFLAELNESNDT